MTETLIEHGINASLIPHQPGDMTSERVAVIIQAHAEVRSDEPANARLGEIIHRHLVMLRISGTGRPAGAARVVS